MNTTARYQVTYVGNGVVRLPRAGIFQTGTRAVVDEQIARIAVAHGSFAVVPLTPDAPQLLPSPPEPVPLPPPAPAPQPQEMPRGRQTKRHSAAMRVPVVDNKGAGSHGR